MSSKQDFKSYIFTGNKSLCTGCGACAQVCTHKAIEMKNDSEGFIYPVVDEKKCVQCGLCDKICPVTGTNTENSGEEQHCYVATTNEEKYYLESASIGICTMLSEYVISNGGIVYGSYLDESNWTAYHIPVKDVNGIQKIRNSKYLQSTTDDTFTQVKEKLNQDIVVLYIGTPCQIAGLKSFLRKPYSNLYTIDLICHGVFSPKLMPLEVDYWERKLGGKIKNFRFRSKRIYKYVNGGMVNFDLLTNGKVKHIERYAASSPTYRCYAYADDGHHYNHRLCCYSCPFRSKKRYGDVTVGDPWFISNKDLNSKQLKSTNTIRSLYSVNTVKGEEMIVFIKDKIVEEEIDKTKAFIQPAFQSIKIDIPEKRFELYKLICKQDYGTLVEKLLICNLEDSQIAFKTKYKKLRLKGFLKKIFYNCYI